MRRTAIALGQNLMQVVRRRRSQLLGHSHSELTRATKTSTRSNTTNSLKAEAAQLLRPTAPESTMVIGR